MKTPGINRIISCLTLIITAAFVSSDAYALLQIYRVKGKVTVTSGKNKWQAQRRAKVVPSDLLAIPAGGSVDILDSESHRIYSSTKSGKMTVKDLIKKAKDHAANITRNINRKVIDAVIDNASPKRSSYDDIGVTLHETDAVLPSLVDIPEDMSYLAYLMSASNDPDSLHQSFISLSRINIESDERHEEAFNFAISSSARKPLYFNVIAKGNDNEIRLLLPVNPIANPQSSTTANEYVFFPDSDTKGYIGIASDSDFSIDDVRHLLDNDYRPEATFYLTTLTVNN